MHDTVNRKHDLQRQQKHFAMRLSLSVAVLMLVGKLGAYFLTGSVAILSDAAESVVHIFATGVAAFGLWFADRPADPNHPYGHGRILLFSVGLEGLLIFSAAVFILIASVHSLIHGAELEKLGLGLAIEAGLALVNLALGLYLISVGKRSGALALVANGQHVLSDMWTSLGVLVGVGLVTFTGLTWIDPVVGVLSALVILYTGTTLIRDVFNQAMDLANTDDNKIITETLDKFVSDGLITGYHQLRHRRVNDILWIELHFLVPGKWTVTEAHGVVTRAERLLEKAFPAQRVTITSHIEPDDHDAAHPKGHFDYSASS